MIESSVQSRWEFPGTLISRCIILSITWYFSALLSITPHCSALFGITRYCSALLSIARHCSALLSIARHCSALLGIARRCLALLDIARHCSALFGINGHCSGFLSIFWQNRSYTNRKEGHRRLYANIIDDLKKWWILWQSHKTWLESLSNRLFAWMNRRMGLGTIGSIL